MESRKINDILICMCEKHINIDFNKKSDLKTQHFFSRKINASASEVAVLLLEIEKVFQVSIDNEFILAGEFSSFDNLYHYLLEKCRLSN